MNASQQLSQTGQSLWYDNIRRGLLHDGTLAGMIARGEIRGVTSNPAIFMNAIANSTDYDADLPALFAAGLSDEEVFFHLAVEDIQSAADLFLPLYDYTAGADGYVSLEVSPRLADDTSGTLAQACELWQRVNRPNLMIKIPATPAGLPAVTAALAQGINVNVTLIFARRRYAEVIDAYLAGLERRAAAGLPLAPLASVASFFVSRLDSKIDPRLESLPGAAPLCGRAAVANACLAYADFKAAFAGARFARLAAQGAKLQRPLWASTGVKNPAYRDVLYVEELIGADTVNTVPPATLAAFLDHGRVRPSLDDNPLAAADLLAKLEALGITMDAVTADLEAEGVGAFIAAFDILLAAIAARR